MLDFGSRGQQPLGVMSGPHPTVRSMAATLGLSRATVSNALRGYPGVAPETRRRVRELAKELGYSPNPFAAEVMSQLKSNGVKKVIGTLGLLDLCEESRPRKAKEFHVELVKGVKERASEMGFSISTWRFGGTSDLSSARLNQILEWRGVRGVVLLPAWESPRFQDLDWSNLTGVYLDYRIESPRLHTVSSDHYRTIFSAMQKAISLGYQRLGFVVNKRANARIDGRWVSAFLGFLHDHPELESLKPLVMDQIAPGDFISWFERERPDVVITHWVEGYEILKRQKKRIPEECGFICLNLQSAPEHLSGFCLQPELIGRRGAEFIVSQLSHNDRGEPEQATATMVPSKWVEGETVRKR